MKHLISYIDFDNSLSIRRLKHFQDCLVKEVFDGVPIDTLSVFPVVQFKLFHENLFIVALDSYGLKFVDKIINEDLSSLEISEFGQKLKISKIHVVSYIPFFLNKELTYKVVDYVPFHTVSYVNFRSMDGYYQQQREYLRRFIKRHVSQLMRYMDMDMKKFSEDLSLEVISFHEKPTRLLYDTMLKPFDVEFRINMLLPVRVGLGRLSKLGFGNIYGIGDDDFN